MSAKCCSGNGGGAPPRDGLYRTILWLALAINAGMFLVEIVGGVAAGSVSLQADAIDFLGDAANYAISLVVLGMALSIRAKAALVKGISLGLAGLWVSGSTLYHALQGTVPEAGIMGVIGTMALLSNVAVAAMLFAFRTGDSNMRSVWICSRNDALGNVAVLLAALGVFGTGTGWPDIVVAAVMAVLSVSGAIQIVRHARSELREARLVPAE
ncbi:MAG TPA: cation transporter [Arenibaculum sp.]|nr:cation transporter [Arenibaculum sp.]